MIQIRNPLLRRTLMVSAIASTFATPAAFASSPITPRFTIETSTVGYPISTARGADGSYVATWSNEVAGPTPRPSPYARVYRRDGSAIGPSFQITPPTATQGPGATSYEASSAAIAPDGSVVVVWMGHEINSPTDIYNARRFSPTGTPLGPVINVATPISQGGLNSGPGIAMDRDGNFAIVWENNFSRALIPALSYLSPLLHYDSTHVRRYAADGTPRGAEIVVHRELPRLDAITIIPQEPAIAMDGDGDFVVIRSTNHRGESSVFAHRFFADGRSAGPAVKVSSPAPLDSSGRLSTTMADNGSFVAAWGTAAPDSTSYVQRFGSSGAAIGTPVALASAPAFTPSVSGDALGNFVAAWQVQLARPGQQTTGAIVARAFSASGAPRGDAFTVAPGTTDFRRGPSVAGDRLGNYAITWSNTLTDNTPPSLATSVDSQLFASP